MTFGSVCSGIEAASLAFTPIGMKAVWFSEISEFPSQVLNHYYSDIQNLGDMTKLPELIANEDIEAPDILCGGTPCQAFSLAGLKQGLEDDRGQLTLSFIDIANQIDKIRVKNGKEKSIILWENVEGVLKDKTNAFHLFISGLAGLNSQVDIKKMPNSGVLYGPSRNVAWRVLDAKFFGLPQQRKRLFVVATDTHINPEYILFETTTTHHIYNNLQEVYPKETTKISSQASSLFNETKIKKHHSIKIIDDEKIEFFRDYTDCLYSAYGTKWNGNAAAYNGSLYLSQNDRVRRLTPLECERLMGFPDNYTLIPKSSDTNRYKAIGNSWAIPVVKWIGNRIFNYINLMKENNWIKFLQPSQVGDNYKLFLFKDNTIKINSELHLNSSLSSNEVQKGSIFDITEIGSREKFYITPRGTAGILRRKNERNINMNKNLESLFRKNSIGA